MPEKLVQTVRAAIEKKGLDWQAAETPQTALSEKEQNALLGLRVTEEELKATAQAIQSVEAMTTLMAAPAAPVSVDWRNNGGNWVTPIKDQSSCGSCVSFGTLAALESRSRIVCKNANLAIDLSEAQLFYCGCGNCCGTGWNCPPALDYCKNTGVGNESSFPYTPGNQPCKSGIAPVGRITSWSAVLSIADRKNIIASKGPMVACMAVYADFFAYRSGVYRRTSNDLRGYHCICVIGYDDSQQCWICKNSWGTGWGDAGFFKIGYGQSGIDTQFPFYDMTAICPGPQPSSCEQYVPYLRRVLQAARTNAMLRACLRHYLCGAAPRPFCSAAVIAVIRNVLLILRRCPQYRRPFCAAL